MPVNPIVPNTWECRSRFQIGGGQTMVMVTNVDEAAGTLTQTLADTIGNVIDGAWGTHLQTHISTSVTYVDVIVTDISVANGAQFTHAVGAAGLVGTDPLPSQISAVVNWRTGVRGPSFRGRTFLGGFVEADSPGQSIGATLLASINSWANAMIADLTTAGHQMVIVSRYTKNPTPPPISIPRVTNLATPVTGQQTDLNWKTMRSRAPAG